MDVFEPITPPQVPLCPSCGSETTRVWTSRTSRVNGDACDVLQENGFPTPRHFTSKRELTRALAEKGLEVRVRHVTIPGTDKSPHTTDWAKGSIDPQTLANAQALVSRAGTYTGQDPVDPDVPITWTIRTLPRE